MRVLTVAALGAAFPFVAATAVAQTAPITPGTPPGVPPAGFEMPGTPVGKPSVSTVGSPVGTRLPTVGTKVPQATASNPFTGNWPSVDPTQVVAPFPGMKKDSLDFWDRLNERWAALFTPPPPQSNFVPGLSRRARERREKLQVEQERRMRD